MGVSRSRRSVLGKAAVAAGAGLLATGGSAVAQGESDGGLTVRGSFKVVDKRGRQAFLATTRKPPIIVNGKVYPPHLRRGPDPATYLIFNDENESEKGGIVASSVGVSISLDYANAQAITIATGWQGKEGGAIVNMADMPDPSLPIEQARAVQRIGLSCHNQHGAAIVLNDSKGRPRIVLKVDENDRPQIVILDTAGKVVSRLG